MKIEHVSIGDIIPYEKNPRKNDSSAVLVAESIRQFGFKVPVVIDANNVIVCGHTRIKALKKLVSEGFEVPDVKDGVPCVRASDLTDEQIKAFRLADNKTVEASEWDFDLLSDELAELGDFDMAKFGFDDINIGSNGEYETADASKKGNLAKKFGVPPFSVLDTRQGYWQDRKRQWLEIAGNLSQTKEGVLGEASIIASINDGSSNFDPVLAELMFRWFSPKGGRILDPFGGEQTKGVVAGELGFDYTAVEFRADQVAVNIEATKKYPNVRYYNGDSNNISSIITERDFDFVFTSPPYYDLEVYSKEDMSALGTYDEFMAQYENIFRQCVEMLAPNRFLVVKICEIRDKKTGIYRNFVGDNISMFKRLGLHYYNEIILVNCVGTVAVRATNSMRNRKIGKLHQNVLVFYKGDIGAIKDNFPLEDIADTLVNSDCEDEQADT